MVRRRSGPPKARPAAKAARAQVKYVPFPLYSASDGVGPCLACLPYAASSDTCEATTSLAMRCGDVPHLADAIPGETGDAVSHARKRRERDPGDAAQWLP